MKTRFLQFLFILYSIQLSAQTTWSVKFSDAIISRYQPNINTMTSKGWEYSNAIILLGIEKTYENTNNITYRNYIQTYVDAYVNSSGVISQSIISLDKLHPAILCLFLYQTTGLLKYKTAATTSRNILIGGSSTYPKTYNGIYWHKDNGSYNNIEMLDGMYMAHPFLAMYGSMFNDPIAIDTAVNQMLFAYNQQYKSANKLLLHAWNSDKTQAWANATTGNSSEIWSRAMGWYMMALVDVLKYVPPTHPKYSQLLTALNNLALGLKTAQDASSGLWYQVMDRGTTLAGNYLESSGSGMFVYAIKTAIDRGLISSATFLSVAQNGWTGLQTKIDTYPTDGLPRINSFAPAMSVQTSAANYAAQSAVSAPVSTGTQHPHGYAGILMAANAMEFNATLPVHFYEFNAKEDGGTIKLSWKNGDDTRVLYYEVQRSTDKKKYEVVAIIHSNGSGNYSWPDKNVIGLNISYRINAVSSDVPSFYSPVIKLKLKSITIDLQVTPNPITNGNATVQISNVKPGRYELNIFGYSGKPTIKRNIDVSADASVISFPIQVNAPKGVYVLQLKGNDILINKKLLIY